MGERWIAHYRCQACGHEFHAPAGPKDGECPKCGHFYLDWLNYDALAKVRTARTKWA